ncbi:MAG: NAD-dependent epimerase/dehydratase family protein [Flavobacteriales bacterium]|nr:NAD-dependent epimerase/dehydratase family protein [Crocinitomicaceae bacterium]NBX81110.1 NAD-dependent epimerase/dehydratase family protein [Flavobacteriales bacterium]NCA20073.1 NAD-dependent epimerase/dehydratase family protein [Crocinitomicaceae bacterium]
MKRILVFGAGGFIGSHLVKRLKSEGNYVVGVDLKRPKYIENLSDEFIIGDLREFDFVSKVISEEIDELYQLAADMGGAGYIFTGEHDADIMHNSVQINVNVAKLATQRKVKALFYASSACIYPEYNQMDPENPKCSEDSAYPAAPDSEYGWEKLFSERLYLSYKRNYGLNVKIARFHNIYGEKGIWNNGKEKAPAALCRKIALAKQEDSIDIWGDGKQTRSFLYIEDCLDALIQLTRSEFTGPYNIGSEEMISINEYALLIAEIANKKITINHISGPQGVRGRSSDNRLIEKDLNWFPKNDLKAGTNLLYKWIESQVYEK